MPLHFEFVFARCSGCGHNIKHPDDARQLDEKYYCPACYELEKKKTVLSNGAFQMTNFNVLKSDKNINDQVAIAPNGNPIFKCYKCGERGTNDSHKLVQIDGFKNPDEFHAVRLCERCREYLKSHDFPMNENF